MMRLWFFAAILSLLSLSACATLRGGDSVTVIDYPEVLEDAHHYYRHHDFERAEAEVQRYLASSKDVYWYESAQLLLGEIRENSGRNAEAVDAYKKVLTHAEGYHSASAAKALYRLSWIYERESKYDDLLVTLLDLQRALGQGDNFVKLIETPARLANVYYILGQWDKALAERGLVSDEVMDQYRDQAKLPENIFQAKLYRSFLGMQPISTTPVKSQEILALTQKELLSIAEMANNNMAKRAFLGLETEYERYFTQVKELKPTNNAVETSERNKKKIVELAKFVDFIQELRASRRPPELVNNQTMNLEFFRKMQAYEDQARALTKKLEIGVQKAKKDGNAIEPAAPDEKKPAEKKPAGTKPAGTKPAPAAVKKSPPPKTPDQL